MTAEPELTRRLHELADSVGGWDDPLTAIRRQAAAEVEADGTANTARLESVPTPTSTPMPTSTPVPTDADVDDDAEWDALVRRPDRRRLSWKVPAAAAAAILGVSAIGTLARLLPSADSSSKTSGSALSSESSTEKAVAAAGTSASRRGSTADSAHRNSRGASVPGYADFSCAPLARRLASITLRAPAQVRSAARVTAVVTSPLVTVKDVNVQVFVVNPDNAVVGALRHTDTSKPHPMRGPNTDGLTGVLSRWSCADGGGPYRSTVPAQPLPVGPYRLVAVLVEPGASTAEVSAPVGVSIARTSR